MRFLALILLFHLCCFSYGQSALKHLQDGLEKHYYNDFEGAIQEYSQAIQLDSMYRDAYFHRGVCLSDIDKYNESINDLSKAIALDSNFTKAYYVRGIVHFNNGEMELSINDLNKTIELDSLYPHAFITRGKIYLMMEAIEKACEDFIQANENGDSEALSLMNKHCLASKDKEE